MGENTTYRIKCSPSLFDEGKGLRHEPLHLAAIVQNDIELTHEELVEWNTIFKNHIEKLKAWRLKVLQHIDKCNGLE